MIHEHESSDPSVFLKTSTLNIRQRPNKAMERPATRFAFAFPDVYQPERRLHSVVDAHLYRVRS